MTLDIPELAPGPFRDFLQHQPALALGLAVAAALVLGLLLGAWFFGGRKRQIQRLKTANQTLETEKQRLLERLATPQPPTARSLPPLNQALRPTSFSQAETAPKVPPAQEKTKAKTEDEVPSDPPTVRMPAPMTSLRSPAPEIARPPAKPVAAAPATRVLRPPAPATPTAAKPAPPSPVPPPAAAAASPTAPAGPATPQPTQPAAKPRIFPPAPPAPDLATKLPAAPATPPVFASQPLHLLPEEEVHKVDSLLRELRNQASSAVPEETETPPGCEPFSFLLADAPSDESQPPKEEGPPPQLESAAWHSTAPGFLLAEDEHSEQDSIPLTSAVPPAPNFASLASALGSIRAPLTTAPALPASVLLENVPKSDNKLGLVYRTRPSQVDDLTRIHGVDALMQTRLNTLGIYRFHQISHWQQIHKVEFGRILSIQDRIEREAWVPQAKRLAAQ